MAGLSLIKNIPDPFVFPESLIREAIEFHIEGLKSDGLPIPLPSSQVEYVDVPA